MSRRAGWVVGLAWILAGCGDESGSSTPADCVALNQMMVMCGQVDAGDDDFGRICADGPTGRWMLELEACRIEADGMCSVFEPCANRVAEQ